MIDDERRVLKSTNYYLAEYMRMKMMYEYPEIPLQVLVECLAAANNQSRMEFISRLYPKWQGARQGLRGFKFVVKNNIRIVVAKGDDPDKVFNLIEFYDKVALSYAEWNSE